MLANFAGRVKLKQQQRRARRGPWSSSRTRAENEGPLEGAREPATERGGRPRLAARASCSE